jgi:WhiB family redox-sensing transcriptional regulator
MDRGWMRWAACKNSYADAWFPAKGHSGDMAKRVCLGGLNAPPCPVRARCLAYALGTGQQFGIWGGLSEHERRILKSAR